MSLPDKQPEAVPLPAPSQTVEVRRWQEGEFTFARDVVAEEVPVALTYHGIAHVVMMATPTDLEDLGVGFTLTEGLVERADEIRSVEALTVADGCELKLTIAPERFAALLRRQRNLTGRTGCGLCGTETLDQALRQPARIGRDIDVSAAQLHAALAHLKDHQPLNTMTGSIHAAAWCMPEEGIRIVREDVGRHNALDKVIGALVRGEHDAAAGYLVISSRASFEMVQKAAIAGVSVLAAISAPTALAIRLADRCGLTLVGFARDRSHVVYTHPARVRP